jgi:vitamin B12 transporter
MCGSKNTRLYYSKTFAPLALIALWPPSASAETEADIIVSAGRTGRPIETIGSSVSTVSAADLARGQYVFVHEALRALPGAVVAQNGGAGGVAGIRLRGSSAGQTLVVIDGVRANDPAAPQGGFNAANLSAAGIEKIEVLRGPQGLAWGADAIGGVISVTTAAPSGRAVEALAEGGAYGTARAAFALSAGRQQSSYVRADITAMTTEGFSRASAGAERDGYRTVSGVVRVGVPLFGALQGEIIGRAQHAVAEIDGFPPPAFSLADTDEQERTDEMGFTARLAHRRTGDRGAEGAMTIGFHEVDRANFDGGAETFSALGRRLSAGYVIDIAVSRAVSLTAGAEGERQSVDVSDVDKDAYRGGAFFIAEWRAQPFAGSALTLSAGARRDEFSNFAGAATARVAAAMSFGDRIVMRASWGEGYRAPTLFELNFSQFGVVPNPDLRPESASGYDFGAEWRSGGDDSGVVLRTTYFDTHVRDLIDFSFARNGYFNLNRSRSRGVETQWDLRVNAFASVGGTYVFLDAKDLSTGAPAPRQPRHRGSAALTIAPIEALNLSAVLIVNGRERDFPTDNDAFARLDLRSAWRLSRTLEIYGRIENATNTDYEDVSGYGETGRAAYAGLRTRL